ncbi:MAG: carboxy terminal-processing peptidase [Desulfuromonadales bacterium]|nr:carboxy terminal-processing peptidase [Desulfuromonadales bacterium]
MSLFTKTMVRSFFIVLVLLWQTASIGLADEPLNTNRARLLGHILHQQLGSQHYNQKLSEIQLSQTAFDLYLKQLDPQKRFLLQEDVEQLQVHRNQIDNAIRRGRLDLPLTGRELLQERIRQVQTLTATILDEPIDPDADEVIENDPDKYEFAANLSELRELWRKNIKFQLLSRYISLRENDIGLDEHGELLPVDKESHAELLDKSRDNVAKAHNTFLSRMLAETEQDHYDRYLDSIARAYDPHTNYMPPTSKEDFDIQMSGSLEGIGATLRDDDGFIRVVRVIPGGAAARQGQLEADDIILKVAEGTAEPVEVTNTRLRDAVSLIRGKKGTEVRLTLRKPDGRRLMVPIIRDVVEIEESFVRSTLIDGINGARIGYVKIPSFYRDHSGKTERNSTDDTRDELLRLKEQGISGLILDLRNNGGGSLTDAVSVTGLFIDGGPVVQVRDSSGAIRSMRDDNKNVAYDGPMIVLVNRFSASASEILAGALQDYGRALIVGDEHTHGKGTVQAVLDLDRFVRLRGMSQYMPLGAAKVTIQKFYRITGESTQERGIIPDIILPSRLDGLESGEKYIENALPWDRIDPAKFSSWKRPPDNLENLRQRSLERISNNKEFVSIIKAAQRSAERRQQTTQSLQLETMLKERRQLQEEQKSLNTPHGVISPNMDNGDKSREEALTEVLNDDPYVQEGKKILNDLVSAFASV